MRGSSVQFRPVAPSSDVYKRQVHLRVVLVRHAVGVKLGVDLRHRIEDNVHPLVVEEVFGTITGAFRRRM